MTTLREAAQKVLDEIPTGRISIAARVALDDLRAALASSTPDPRGEDVEYAPGETVMNLYDKAREEGRKAGIEEACKALESFRSCSDVRGMAKGALRLIAQELRASVRPATHRCKTCGALWALCGETGCYAEPVVHWHLRSPKAGPCCDNAPMSDQIEPLAAPAPVPSSGALDLAVRVTMDESGGAVVDFDRAVLMRAPLTDLMRSAVSSETRTAPAIWETRSGTFEVRASCPRHPFAPMRRFGEIARCSECGDAIAICDDICGWKHCVREKGHAGLHVSPSGTSWPNQRAPRPQGDSDHERKP